jgi:hypothetical protein
MSDATEHTPGPWEWQFMGTAGRWCMVNADGLGAVHLGGPPDVPLSADQRLTQASPDLLEALRAVEPFMIPSMDWTDDTGRMIVAMVRAAIAKAN